MKSVDDYYHERPPYELPVPDLEPQPITSKDYFNCTPEKLELFSGFLVNQPKDNYWRDLLLSLLLKNQGLLRVVRLAPKYLWEQALSQGYEDTDKPLS